VFFLKNGDFETVAQSEARDRSLALTVLPTAFQTKFGERQGGVSHTDAD